MIERHACAVVRRTVVLGFLLCSSCFSAASQDVSLEVRTRSGRSAFHAGEVILLDLAFTARLPGTYQLITGQVLPVRYPLRDTFRLEPVRGWEDPLRDYRKATIGRNVPFSVSFLGSTIILGSEPYVLRSIILNDYVRFSQPGVYRLRVEDSRVTALRTDMKPVHLILTSNSLVLTILPADAQWQQNQLRKALDSLRRLRDVIRSGARSYPAALNDSCVTIRALGTNEAGAAMVDALRDEEIFSRCGFQTGIWEFPNKRFIVERMKQLQKDSDVAITLTFFETMATTSLLAVGRPDQLFSVPREIDQQIKQEILEALPAKRGSAKIATIDTLVRISFAPYGASTGGFRTAPKHITGLDLHVLKAGTDNFDQLSHTAQRMLLNYRKAQHPN